MENIEKIGLGGGCHWCTEGIFQSLVGVIKVDQGWISFDESKATYSEGIIVYYDTNTISLATLIEIHLLTHSSSSNHPLRHKYRSAIYYFNKKQQIESQFILSEGNKTGNQCITTILPMAMFKLNKQHYLNYYTKNPEAPFCQRYITPKLQKLLISHKNNIQPLIKGKIANSKGRNA